MKIELIILPAPYLIDQKVFPPLGILYLASYLEQQGHKVTVYDLLGVNEWEKEVEKIASNDSHVIGISATTPDFPIAIKTLKIIKKVNSLKSVVIGGAHATLAPEECVKAGFDNVIVGEGWTGFEECIKNPKQKIHHGKMINNWDKMPPPARHLIDMDSYHYEIDGVKSTNIITQMGCPFSCIFCSGRNVKEFRKVRKRSALNIMQEIDYLKERFGYEGIMFFDDEINIDNIRLITLCHMLKKRNVKWRALARTNLTNEYQIKVMAECGCKELLWGIESGSQKILDLIKKGTTVEQNNKAIELCKKYGIRTKALVIVGFPSETKQDIMLTKKWLLDNKPDDFDVTILTPYPGSDIYDNNKEYDFEFHMDYSHDVAFYKGVPGKYKSYVRNSHLSYKEIVALRDDMEEIVRNRLGLKPRKND